MPLERAKRMSLPLHRRRQGEKPAIQFCHSITFTSTPLADGWFTVYYKTIYVYQFMHDVSSKFKLVVENYE